MSAWVLHSGNSRAKTFDFKVNILSKLFGERGRHWERLSLSDGVRQGGGCYLCQEGGAGAWEDRGQKRSYYSLQDQGLLPGTWPLLRICLQFPPQPLLPTGGQQAAMGTLGVLKEVKQLEIVTGRLSVESGKQARCEPDSALTRCATSGSSLSLSVLQFSYPSKG